MDSLFFVVFILGLVGLIIGLIKPELVVRWGKVRTRGRALLTYFVVCAFAGLGLVMTIAPPEMNEVASTEPTQQTNNSGPNLEWKTKEGHFLASLNKELLDKAVGYAAQNDLQALDSMIKAELVFPLKAGMTVILEDGSMFGSYVKIRAKGANFSFYTVREAITQ